MITEYSYQQPDT